jgi:hypothetical protein
LVADIISGALAGSDDLNLPAHQTAILLTDRFAVFFPDGTKGWLWPDLGRRRATTI